MKCSGFHASVRDGKWLRSHRADSRSSLPANKGIPRPFSSCEFFAKHGAYQLASLAGIPEHQCNFRAFRSAGGNQFFDTVALKLTQQRLRQGDDRATSRWHLDPNQLIQMKYEIRSWLQGDLPLRTKPEAQASRQTRRHLRTLLVQMLTYAVGKHYLPYNPFTGNAISVKKGGAPPVDRSEFLSLRNSSAG